jgi:hypothetical protein
MGEVDLRRFPVSDPDVRIIRFFDQDGAEVDPAPVDDPAPIRVNPAPEKRRVVAFDRLAAVVGRVSTTEVPVGDPAPSDAGILVHARPPEPNGTRARTRQEALDALALAAAAHEAALDESRRSWELVHETEQKVARATEDEAAALRAFELVCDGRRNAERVLRSARSTSRLLDSARIRAERL